MFGGLTAELYAYEKRSVRETGHEGTMLLRGMVELEGMFQRIFNVIITTADMLRFRQYVTFLHQTVRKCGGGSAI